MCIYEFNIISIRDEHQGEGIIRLIKEESIAGLLAHNDSETSNGIFHLRKVENVL